MNSAPAARLGCFFALNSTWVRRLARPHILTAKFSSIAADDIGVSYVVFDRTLILPVGSSSSWTHVLETRWDNRAYNFFEVFDR